MSQGIRASEPQIKMAIVFEREGMGISGEWEARGGAQIPLPSNACQQGRLEW